VIPLVLIIEPEAYLRRVLERRLKKQRYLVVTAANGEEGLVKAAVHLPQLIVINILQFGMNGVEVAEELQKDEKTRHIPVLMHHPKINDQEAFYDWLVTKGVQYHLLRPINVPQFLALVSKILHAAQEDYTEVQ
jgi:CheY-like chemotaxis protein